MAECVVILTDSSKGDIDLRHPYQASRETSLAFADRGRVQNDLHQSVIYIEFHDFHPWLAYPRRSLLLSTIYPFMGIPHRSLSHTYAD